MKVLVVGNGAREHAIVKKLSEEPIDIIAAMAKLNPGIAALSKQVDIVDLNKPENYSKYKDVDIAFIGPETPLAAGIANVLMDMGVPTVGPVRETARLEWSKAYARTVLNENDIHGNPEYKVCRSLSDVKDFLDKHPEVAVKPDVLTGGKGVKVTGQHLTSRSETEAYAAERIRDDGLVVLEKKLIGKEFTLQAFSDGKNLRFMPLVRDFKRAYDNDKGPNTGSMGSFSCPNHTMPDLDEGAVEKGKNIMMETINAMMRKDSAYKGVLYGGFMVTAEDTYLIEYNCRFGDPEAINVLSLLEKPLTKVGYGIIDGKLPSFGFEKQATVCVYIVPEGYPVSPLKDQPIEVGEGINSDIYYASVYDDNSVIKTTTSRSIALLSKGDSVSEARNKVYMDVDKVHGRLHYRTDIAAGVQ
jgi:phosphoribosylamine--glycine ligase